MGGSALSSLAESELNACAKEGKEWTAGARSVVGGGMVRAGMGDLLFAARADGERDGAGLDVVVVDVAASVPVAVVDDERKEVRTVMVRAASNRDSVVSEGFGLQGLGPSSG